MQAYTYNEVLESIKHLTLEEQFQLIEELLALYHRQVKPKPRHSLLELEGLGKEIWEGIDPQKYVDEERNSWGG